MVHCTAAVCICEGYRPRVVLDHSMLPRAPGMAHPRVFGSSGYPGLSLGAENSPTAKTLSSIGELTSLFPTRSQRGSVGWSMRVDGQSKRRAAKSRSDHVTLRFFSGDFAILRQMSLGRMFARLRLGESRTFLWAEDRSMIERRLSHFEMPLRQSNGLMMS